MPAHVVRRSIDAWKRKDLNGIYAEYDSSFFHMFLVDTVVEHVTRAAMIARMKADTGFVQFMNTGHLIKSDVNTRGTWVFNVFTWRDAKGKETMTLDAYRVKHGKIVYEIEG